MPQILSSAELRRTPSKVKPTIESSVEGKDYHDGEGLIIINHNNNNNNYNTNNNDNNNR